MADPETWAREAAERIARPIIFSAPMVRAILAGTKTQTRRVMTPQPAPASLSGRGLVWGRGYSRVGNVDPEKAPATWLPLCPYGVLGDRLWVRETFRQGDGSMSVHYRADPDEVSGGPWRSPIFMPRWASRLTLEIVDVRVQRLQEISEDDARTEGVERGTCTHPDCSPGSCAASRYRPAFALAWDALNARRGFGWDANPWVWILTFRRLTPAPADPYRAFRQLERMLPGVARRE